MKGRRILVTGAGGYIGHIIAEYLHAQGYKVTGTYRRTTVISGFKSIQVDLSKPFEINEDIDVIVHAAGERPERKNEKWAYGRQDFISFKQNNIDTMENVVDFAKKHSVKKIIYLSSIGIYGQMEGLTINEDSKRINPDIYGITKYMAEIMLKECREVKGISLRMPGVIGPGASGVWFTNVAEKLRKGENIIIYTPDFQTKNFVWIDDLVKFIKCLIELDEWKYETLVLACGQSVSIRQIVERIKELTKSDSKVMVDNSIQRSFSLDATKAFEMGYESCTPMEMVEKYFLDL